MNATKRTVEATARLVLTRLCERIYSRVSHDSDGRRPTRWCWLGGRAVDREAVKAACLYLLRWNYATRDSETKEYHATDAGRAWLAGQGVETTLGDGA